MWYASSSHKIYFRGKSVTFHEYRYAQYCADCKSSTWLSSSVVITLQLSLPSHCLLSSLATHLSTNGLLTQPGMRGEKRCSVTNAVFCSARSIRVTYIGFVFPLLLKAGRSPSITSTIALDILPLKLHPFSQSTPTGLDCVGWKRRVTFPGVYTQVLLQCELLED